MTEHSNKFGRRKIRPHGRIFSLLLSIWTVTEILELQTWNLKIRCLFQVFRILKFTMTFMVGVISDGCTFQLRNYILENDVSTGVIYRTSLVKLYGNVFKKL